MHSVDELMAILACPDCKTPVNKVDDEIVCGRCERRYPILDGLFPVMLIDEGDKGRDAYRSRSHV